MAALEDLTHPQRARLMQFAHLHGARWKDKLHTLWSLGILHQQPTGQLLYEIVRDHGADWINALPCGLGFVPEVHEPILYGRRKDDTIAMTPETAQS